MPLLLLVLLFLAGYPLPTPSLPAGLSAAEAVHLRALVGAYEMAVATQGLPAAYLCAHHPVSAGCCAPASCFNLLQTEVA